jgi:hypothetical protein
MGSFRTGLRFRKRVVVRRRQEDSLSFLNIGDGGDATQVRKLLMPALAEKGAAARRFSDRIGASGCADEFRE